jgi:hypothetical protein
MNWTAIVSAATVPLLTRMCTSVPPWSTNELPAPKLTPAQCGWSLV